MTYAALKQSALREADQRDLTDNPHVGGGEPDRWDDDGTSDKLRALVAAIEAKDERVREAYHELTVALQPRRSEVERTACINRALAKLDAALGGQQ